MVGGTTMRLTRGLGLKARVEGECRDLLEEEQLAPLRGHQHLLSGIRMCLHIYIYIHTYIYIIYIYIYISYVYI
jgi:hypothetical protein